MQNKEKILKFKHIIFDLDGVIFDSKNNMRISWRFVKIKFKLKISFNQYFSCIGAPFEEILRKLSITKNVKNIKKFYNLISSQNINKIKTYKNVNHIFSELEKKKITKSVVTSKNFNRSRKFIKNFKLKIDSIHCPNSKKPGKPNPFLLEEAIKISGVKKKFVCYVGDTEIDFIAANRAGIKFIFANYGYGIKKKKYKYIINSISDLKKFI